MSAQASAPLVIVLLGGHVLVTRLIWRDLKRRPRSQLRGSPALWRTLSALNTSGQLAYVLVGRRR